MGRGNLINVLKSLVIKHPGVARTAKAALTSRLVNENRLYKYIYQRKIVSDMQKGEAFPQVVQIEITNHCNADCIMCPRKSMNRLKGIMETALFKKIIDECASQNIDIFLNGYGETLLDKSFIEKLAYARKVFKGKISLFTNGSLLDDKVAEALIRNKIDSVSISVDSNISDQYEKIRRKLSINQVLKNIDHLIEKKRISRSLKPSVTITMVRMKENRDNIENFKNFFSKKADAVYIQNLKNWGGEFGSTADSFHKRSDSDRRSPCHYLWKNVAILWNGEVALCCQDFDGKEIIGDLNKNSLFDIWRGRNLKRYRQAHKEKRFMDIPICADCSYHTVWW